MAHVILDTDIGTDIDDVWALAMLVNCPELELTHVVTCHADTEYRARIAAKMLEAAGRTDVTVATGVVTGELERYPQAAFVSNYALDDYPGPVRRDGVQTIVDAVMQGAPDGDRTIVLSIGPATNVAAALAREPQIADRARFVGMHGAVRKGYRGAPTPVPEYNVFSDVEAFREVLAAPWPVTLTPLDTCGVVYLDGEQYAAVRDADGVMPRTVMANYRAWAAALDTPDDLVGRRSTTLYDTVAVWLAIGDDPFLEMEDVRIEVQGDGLTVEAPGGRTVTAAMAWRDLDGFKSYLTSRLLGES